MILEFFLLWILGIFLFFVLAAVIVFGGLFIFLVFSGPFILVAMCIIAVVWLIAVCLGGSD